MRRRGGGRDDRDGGRGGDRGTDRGGERGGQRMVGGRPRKTQEELDREMEDYWGSKGEQQNGGAEKMAEPAVVVDDMDIEMIS